MKSDRYAGIVLLIFSVLFYFSVPYTIQYNIYSKNVKGVFGADALPELLAGLLGICAVFLIMTGFQGRKEETGQEPEFKLKPGAQTGVGLPRSLHSVMILAVCLVYIACIRTIGYFISTFFMLFVMFLLFGERRLQKAAFWSAAVVIPIYLIFGLFLKLYLPRGILF